MPRNWNIPKKLTKFKWFKLIIFGTLCMHKKYHISCMCYTNNQGKTSWEKCSTL